MEKKAENFEQLLKQNENHEGFLSHISDLDQQIKFLQNEKCILEERINSFMNENEIQVFENGHYNDNIRAVYEDLLVMGISTRNVEDVIRIVLKKLAGLDASKLPGPTFAKYMLLEARTTSQLHILSELAEDTQGTENEKLFSESNTLHSDGTSKKGHSLLTYDITTLKGKSLTVGLRPTASGDAEMQLKVFKDIIEDIPDFSSDKSFVSKTFASINNLI